MKQRNGKRVGKWVNKQTGSWRTGEEERGLGGWGSGCWVAWVNGYMLINMQEGQAGGEKAGKVDGRLDWREDRCEKGRDSQEEKRNGKIHGQEDKVGDGRNG